MGNDEQQYYEENGDQYYNYNYNYQKNDDEIYYEDEESFDSWNDSELGINYYFVAFLSLLVVALVLAKLLHDQPVLSKILPEAGMFIIVGVIAGGIIYSTTLSPGDDDNEGNNDDVIDYEDVSIFVAEGLLSFSPKVFFFVLLPPIIFNSGYNIKRDVFLRHFTPITLFACAGTAISTIVVALTLWTVKILGLTGGFQPRFTELMAFGALISATDPVSTLAVFQAKQVDPQLFYLVFGESVLNDAVGLVLFKTLSKFVGKEESFGTFFVAAFQFLGDFFVSFIGSMIVGVFSGIVSALFFKKVDMRKTPLLELSLFLLIMYMPFFVAEVMELSGIVTILFTGLSAKCYATQNLSKLTEGNVDALFRVTAHLAETSIFLELGLSVFGLWGKEIYEWKFVIWAIFSCLLGRALNVYPLRTFYNRLLCAETIEDLNDQLNCTSPPLRQQVRDEDDDTIPNADSLYSLEGENSITPRTRKDLKIRNNTAHMLWFSGLRGAVAYACAKTFPNAFGNRTSFVFVTMAIVLFTVFVFGCTTDWALNRLNIEINVDEDTYMEDNNTTKKMRAINQLENRFIKPLVTRENELVSKNGAIELGSIESNESGVWSDDSNETKHTANTPASSSKIHHQSVDDDHQRRMRNLSRFQHFQRTGTSASHERRRENSLYDYGLGPDYGMSSQDLSSILEHDDSSSMNAMI